eukprot:TRINITY_DN13821_c0_g2_i1.p1 TRINITY_DN13821_c0_g2~~TRINITY_DN13821_c0_g2_i1.p1  ORF type:complete len:427 (+),score=110.41 TRINITY_DN13821_c0_g2_i1:88-1368(+)
MAAVNICAVKPPKDAYMLLADKGHDTTKYSSMLVFFQSFYAGCYIGFGALLAATIASTIPGATEDNPGLQNFVFAALFPVNLLLILLSGGMLFTGTSAACPAAVYEGKVKVLDAVRCLVLSWIGNVLGSGFFAFFTKWCELLDGPTGALAVKIMEKKVSKGFATTFLKGIGCNWMVCMAVFLCGQAQDMTGKYLGIWFPISTFVMIGFEHIPANFYLCEIGLLVDSDSEVTFLDVLVKNWIPVTLGNFVAGAFIVAGGYSYVYGRFGQMDIFSSSKASEEGKEAPRKEGDVEEASDKDTLAAAAAEKEQAAAEALEGLDTFEFESELVSHDDDGAGKQKLFTKPPLAPNGASEPNGMEVTKISSLVSGPGDGDAPLSPKKMARTTSKTKDPDVASRRPRTTSKQSDIGNAQNPWERCVSGTSLHGI